MGLRPLSVSLVAILASMPAVIAAAHPETLPAGGAAESQSRILRHPTMPAIHLSLHSSNADAPYKLAHLVPGVLQAYDHSEIGRGEVHIDQSRLFGYLLGKPNLSAAIHQQVHPMITDVMTFNLEGGTHAFSAAIGEEAHTVPESWRQAIERGQQDAAQLLEHFDFSAPVEMTLFPDDHLTTSLNRYGGFEGRPHRVDLRMGTHFFSDEHETPVELLLRRDTARVLAQIGFGDTLRFFAPKAWLFEQLGAEFADRGMGEALSTAALISQRPGVGFDELGKLIEEGNPDQLFEAVAQRAYEIASRQDYLSEDTSERPDVDETVQSIQRNFGTGAQLTRAKNQVRHGLADLLEAHLTHYRGITDGLVRIGISKPWATNEGGSDWREGAIATLKTYYTDWNDLDHEVWMEDLPRMPADPALFIAQVFQTFAAHLHQGIEADLADKPELGAAIHTVLTAVEKEH